MIANLRSERLAKLERAAATVLKYHEVLPGSGLYEDKSGSQFGRWLVGVPSSCISSLSHTAVFTTGTHVLVLPGDNEAVHFKCSCPHYDPVDLIRWAATAELGYLVTTAATGSAELYNCYDVNVALSDIDERIQNACRKVKKKRWAEVRKALVEDAANELEIRCMILNFTNDPDISSGVGRCVAPRVIWAWLLLRKLHQLLGESTGEP